MRLGDVVTDADEFALAIRAKRLKGSFLEFVRDAWEHATGYDYIDGQHIAVIVRHLDGVASGEITRLLINVPPSTFKTVLTGVMFPAWCWARGQAEDFLYYSYNVQLAIDSSTMCRELIGTPWYRAHFPGVAVSADDDSKQYFRISGGGSRRVSPIGGGGTGYHPSIIVIDDPLSRDEADSATERERVRRWYFETISSRGLGKGARHIVQQQRLHVDDLSGHIARHANHLATAYGASPWHHIRLPMRYDAATRMPDRGYGGEWRTVPGELLYPVLLDDGKVTALERSLGPMASRAQLGQDPRRGETSFFKVDRIRIIPRDETPPKFSKLVRAWDLASTEGGGDYTVGVLMGSYRPMSASIDHYCILDVVRQQTSDPLGAMMLASAMDRRWGTVLVGVELQPAAAGQLLDRQIRQRLTDATIVSIRPAGSKEYRFGPVAGEISFGGLSIIDGPYVPAFLAELESYPGAHDDQGDAAAMAYSALVESGQRGLVIADEIPTTAPQQDERCANQACKRPNFGHGGYCCECCEVGSWTHTPQCNHAYSDWFVERMPTEQTRPYYGHHSPPQVT